MASFSNDPADVDTFKKVFGTVCTTGAAKPIHEPGCRHKGTQYVEDGIVAYDTYGSAAPLKIEGPGVEVSFDKRVQHLIFDNGDATKLAALGQKLGL